MSTGPVHGAARNPATLPIRNAPARPDPPTEFRRSASPSGRVSSNAPNMLAARTRRNTASPMATAGWPRSAPKAAPVRAAMTPSVANTTPMPTT